MKYVQYRKGYKYQLAGNHQFHLAFVRPDNDISTEWICLTKDGLLTIYNGYASDGPSGATIDTRSSMRGSFVHDALYQLLRMGLLPQSMRQLVDDEAQRIWIEDGMWKFRARLWHRELRKFGASAADPSNVKIVYTAP